MRRLPTTALAAVAVALLAAACGGGDDDGGGGGSGLPEVEGTEAPSAYRVLYEVTTPDGRGQEEHLVQRPFASVITERGADGAVISRRTSDLGLLVTDTEGEEVAVETAVAPALGDLRLDRFAGRLVEAERLVRDGDGEVGGRPCARVVEPEAVATDRAATAEGDGRVSVRIERCVDAVGIVLEERVVTPGGQAVRTKRAVELELGDDVPEVEAPDVEPLAVQEGGGVVEEVEGAGPAAASFAVQPPDGFERVGRFTVQPATVGSQVGAGSIALVTDVWRRGPDVLLLDQGRAIGATPFDPATEVERLDLEGIGPAVLAIDLRVAEVRVSGAEGAFVRVAGTLPLEDLLEVARTLQPAG